MVHAQSVIVLPIHRHITLGGFNVGVFLTVFARHKWVVLLDSVDSMLTAQKLTDFSILFGTILMMENVTTQTIRFQYVDNVTKSFVSFVFSQKMGIVMVRK